MVKKWGCGRLRICVLACVAGGRTVASVATWFSRHYMKPSPAAAACIVLQAPIRPVLAGLVVVRVRVRVRVIVRHV